MKKEIRRACAVILSPPRRRRILLSKAHGAGEMLRCSQHDMTPKTMCHLFGLHDTRRPTVQARCFAALSMT